MWDERWSQSGFAYGTEPDEFLAFVRVGFRSIPNSATAFDVTAVGVGSEVVMVLPTGANA